MKNKIIIASVFILLLSTLAILNLKKSESSTKTPFLDTTSVISAETTNSTKTTKTTHKTSKNTTTKRIKSKINYNQQEILNYVHQEVLNMGWSSADYEATVNILIKESGINPNSVNRSSGACGLFQAHPCKKAIKQYPDYMTNYKSQVKWGLNYIKDRYKTPSKAWKYWQQYHSY